MPAGPLTSIVLPCHNGEPYVQASLKTLGGFLASQQGVLGPSEIVFVDDGSTDRTAEIVSEAFPEVRLLRHERNRGKGAAVRTGVGVASAPFVFFMDADLPYELDVLPRMLHYLDHKEFHLCLGTRTRGSVAARSLPRRIASAVFTEFVGRIVVTGIRDTQCGVKGFRAEVARPLFAQSRVDNFAFDVEIIYLAFKNDLDLKKIPVKLRQEEHSSVSLLRHSLPMLLEILALPLRYHAGHYAPLETGPGPRE